MPGRCSAPRCTNSNQEGYCLTRFAQDPKVRQAWIDAAEVPDWKPTKSATLCEVHFHPSALYCLGSKKFIKKNVTPSFFCKCDEHIKRKLFAEVQLKEQDESIESLSPKKAKSDHSYFFPSTVEQRNTSSKKNQYVNKFKEHNYVFVRKNTEYSNFQSQKKEHTGKYVHISDCIVKKKPITIGTLKKALSEKENDKSDSDSVEYINTSPKITASEILSTESSPSPEEFKLLKETLEKTKKENDVLKTRIEYLEKTVEENIYVINKVLNKDQQEAILRGTTRGSAWSDETIKKGLILYFACGSHGYKQIIDLVAPFPALKTLDKEKKRKDTAYQI